LIFDSDGSGVQVAGLDKSVNGAGGFIYINQGKPISDELDRLIEKENLRNLSYEDLNNKFAELRQRAAKGDKNASLVLASVELVKNSDVIHIAYIGTDNHLKTNLGFDGKPLQFNDPRSPDYRPGTRETTFAQQSASFNLMDGLMLIENDDGKVLPGLVPENVGFHGLQFNRHALEGRREADMYRVTHGLEPHFFTERTLTAQHQQSSSLAELEFWAPPRG
jgi:hypothetical protein